MKQVNQLGANPVSVHRGHLLDGAPTRARNPGYHVEERSERFYLAPLNIFGYMMGISRSISMATPAGACPGSPKESFCQAPRETLNLESDGDSQSLSKRQGMAALIDAAVEGASGQFAGVEASDWLTRWFSLYRGQASPDLALVPIQPGAYRDHEQRARLEVAADSQPAPTPLTDNRTRPATPRRCVSSGGLVVGSIPDDWLRVLRAFSKHVSSSPDRMPLASSLSIISWPVHTAEF
ncbi:hypothetical protein CIHG_02826 [Coccidioides immitis H538.4]|uniref:Uncharacterized protein n=2 Tax=Coccidioides immitis TaxID=5501 RepID=A0A0J8RM53_COCIT|nr:hypothetical protein CIRG_07538 [Coccidioides immitis RMSCC 2394]KMU85044.1 hypothetical protein CIHG_02826 [Coccidioides immitis H538.4]